MTQVVKGYKDNLMKRERAAKRRTAMKVALAEAKALGGEEVVEAAKLGVDNANLDYEVMDGLVKRQESIKGFVTKESRAVEEKRARIRDFEQQLLLVTID